jgi:hypothetical protein
MNHHQKGTQVSHTTRSARTPFLRTGLIADGSDSLRGGGSGVGFRSGITVLLRLGGLLTLTVTVLALLALSASSASAGIVHPYKSEITEASGSGFCTAALAVDSATDLYLGDNCFGILNKLDSSGAPVSSWGTGGQITEVEGTHLRSPKGLATDSSDDLWVSESFQGAVFKFDSAGNLLKHAEGPEPGGGFPFGGSQLFSVAWSDAANKLFVADSGEDVLWGIEPDGTYSGTSFSSGLGGGCCQIQAAADNSGGEADGDLYVSTGDGVHRIQGSGAEAGEPDAFSFSAPYVEGGVLTGTSLAPFGEITGLAVDSAGDLYVAQGLEVDQFAPSGRYLGRITGTPTGPGGEFKPFTQVNNVAVGSVSGNLYVGTATAVEVFDATGLVLPDVTTGAAEAHDVTSATVNGEVNPLGISLTECFFEYGPTTAYGQSAECEPAAASIPGDESEHPVTAELEGLTPGTTYHYRLVAANANGTNKESGDQELFTGASIDSTSVSGVSGTAATLETEINPHGLATSFHFEYGTTTAYGESTSVESAGSGNTDVRRSVQIGSLQPNTTYHFRVLAENSLGTTEGPDRTFTTQGAAEFLLPDGRGWELVSPADKHGTPLEAHTSEGGLIQAADDGEAITYFAKGSATGEAEGSRSGFDSQLLSSRASGAWSTADISTPHQAIAPYVPGNPSEYAFFSEDLSIGALAPTGATPLSPLATEKTPYLRRSDGTFTPLVTATNVPPGVHFAGTELPGTEVFQRDAVEILKAASPDSSNLLITSPQPLTEDFQPGFEAGQSNIYRWHDGALQLVSWIPAGSGSACGGSGPACLPASEVGQLAKAGGVVGAAGFQLRRALSSDGSRVFFETSVSGGAASTRRLWLRNIDQGESVQLDAAEPGCATCESGGGIYHLASVDGSRVFFTDGRRLTSDSQATNLAPDLYMCDITEVAGGLSCDLSDLTSQTLNPGEPAGVLGSVIGASEDGSDIYFVANGALTEGEGAVHGNCPHEAGIAAQSCNLYRYNATTGQTRLIAVLSGLDQPDWNVSLTRMVSRVSPNGRYLAFMSSRSLTGYDNRDAETGARDQEVFLYDSQGAPGHQLSCPSCNPSGSRPHGIPDPDRYPNLLVDRGSGSSWAHQTLAAILPTWVATNNVADTNYQPRFLSDSGRLFFNSADALVPADSNGTFDVYQFEFPQGPGQPADDSCTVSSSTYSPTSGGCVSLISSGTSPAESAFLDASRSGDDVFFMTASRLSPRDVDTAFDIYDARVGGGEAQPVKPVECSGDACQQPAVPPNDATPGSLTFNGAGNVKECPKGRVNKAGKCISQKAKKKHKAKKHHKKSHKKQKKSKRANADRGGAK